MHMGIIGSSIVGNKIGPKSSVIDLENLVISGVNAQGNRQADLMLMV